MFKSKKFFYFILALVLIAAALLRFIGTNPGYNKFHSDEGISYSAAVSMIKNENLDPLRYDYPSIVPYSNYIFFRFVMIPSAWIGYYLSHFVDILDGYLRIPLTGDAYKIVFQREILGEREVHALIWGRYVTALFSFGSVILVYLFGSKFFGKWVGLLAALLLAVNFRSVTNAHIGLPDTYNAFFLLLSFLAFVEVFLKGGWQKYLIAGACIGLFISTKYQIFIIFPFLATHFLSSSKHDLKKIFLSPKFLMTLLVIPLVFIILNPYLLINFEKTREWLTLIYLKYGTGRDALSVYPISYLFNIDYGPGIFLLSIFGIITGLLSNFKKTAVLLAFLIPFFFVTVFYTNGGFYVRNFITITPLMMILAANGIYFLFTFLQRKLEFLVSLVITLVIVIASVYPTLRKSVINSYYYTKPWAYDSIVIEARKVLSNNQIVVSHPFDALPPELILNRPSFEVDTNYSFAEFRSYKADYAFVNMDWASNYFYSWMNRFPPDSFKYWNKPLKIIRDTFEGISIEEMLGYVSVYAYKPWQAPDSALFLSKIPYFDKYVFQKAYSEDFKDTVWKVINASDMKSGEIKNDNSFGRSQKGSMSLNSIYGDFNISRVVSEPIKIEPGYVYRATAYVFSPEEIVLKKRDGFLRIDFYTEGGDLSNRGVKTSVSERYYGIGWKKLEVASDSPNGAATMTISFQLSGKQKGQIYFDDVVLEKATEKFKPEPNLKQIKIDEYVDLLYPFSHGNL